MSWTLLAPRATLRTRIIAFLILMASLIAPVYSTPAHAALAAAGPLDPATKFPFWYQDANGLRLGYCFDPVFCFLGAQLPNPNQPPSVPNNFPAEMFYWDADASMPTNNGGLAFMRLGVEAAFLPGPGVVDGDQVTFARIRFRLDNLQAGATYTITHPYGVDTFVAQTGGVRGVNATTDVGCVPKVAGVACDVTLALGSRIGPFLTWDTFGSTVDAPPAGFIGNFAVPHRVTGSPLGTNFFRVDGPNVGGPGVNSIQTDLFQVSGQISGVAVTASPVGGLFNKAQAVSLTASDPAATIFFTTDGTTPTTASTKYTGTPINIAATTTLKYMAVDAQGTQSPVGTQVYTIDTVPPVVSLTAKPANPTNKANPSFTFTADKAGTTFACSLALGTAADAFTACSSPKSYSGLADGSYTFKVRGTDPAGNVSVTPYTFTIDTVPPVVSLTAKPAALSTNTNPSFTFTATKTGTTFQCVLDGAALAACSSPKSYSGLADGSHTFTVKATDPAGNSSAASTAFTIDTTPPVVPQVLTARAASVSEIDLSWTAATDPAGVAGYQVFRDGGTTPLAIVSTGTTFADTGLAASSTHSYTVVAYDTLGNVAAHSAVATATTLALAATPTPTVRPATATPRPSATPRPTATKTPRPVSRQEQPTVTMRVPRGIILHGAAVVVQVRTRPNANALITLRLTRQGTRCTGTARQRVCKSVTTVLAQRVVHGRANRQGLLTRSVALSYSPASALRATLGVHVSTPYGAVTHAAAVLLQPAPRARQR